MARMSNKAAVITYNEWCQHELNDRAAVDEVSFQAFQEKTN